MGTTDNEELRSTIAKRDELGKLSSNINEMIEGLAEKNRLEVENSVIEARNDENRKYLDNISEGLLLVDRDQIISDQYSTYLESLFGTKEIAGRKLSDFVFADEPDDAETKREVSQLIELIFANVNTDMDMIMSINPLENKTISVKRNGSSEEIVINAQFQRIVTDSEVSNVMIIFEDKTALVRAEQDLEIERKRSVTEIEHIQAILRSGPESFIEFVEEALKVLGTLDESTEMLDDENRVKELFRALHSLKGAARYMELRNFAAGLHETENKFAALRDGARKPDAEFATEVRERLEGLYQEVENIKKINDRFKEFATQDGVQGLFAGSVRGFFENIQRMAADISAELEREVRLTTSTEFDTLPILRELRDPIIHPVRNAIDHGIEPSIERISNGKPETGTVEVRVKDAGGGKCVVEVRDDGAGVDFEAVKARGIEKGLISGDDVTEKTLIRLLFIPSFSSRSETTELSGRGIGLDVVHDTVKRLGGSVAIASRRGIGTRIALTVPLEASESDANEPTEQES